MDEDLSEIADSIDLSEIADSIGPFYFTWFYPSPIGQNGRLFADDIFKRIFVNEKFCILIEISIKFVPKGQIDNNTALVQIMAWRRIGDKPLSETMMTWFPDAYMRHWGEVS